MKAIHSAWVFALLASNLGLAFGKTYNLINADSWKCFEGTRISGHRNLTIHSVSRAIIPVLADNSDGKPDLSSGHDIPEHQPLVNLFGQRYKVAGDFAVTFTQEVPSSYPTNKGLQYQVALTSGWVPMLNIYGTNVPFIMDEMYIDSAHIGIGISAGGKSLLVYMWDGMHYNAVKKYNFKFPKSHNVRVQFSRHNDKYSFTVNNRHVGSVSFPGLFANGNPIYFGTDIPHGGKMVFTEFTLSGAVQPLRPQGPFLGRTAKIDVPHNSLRALAATHGLNIGTCVAVNQLFDSYEPIYADTLAHNFNMITSENAMKWQFLHPEPNTYTFCEADGLVNWAHGNNVRYHAHTLVWDEALPWWLMEGKYSSTQLKNILHDHITTVVGHYRGRVQEWDVLNEPLEDDSDQTGPRHSLWYDNAFKGNLDEYVSSIFHWARKSDPHALLCVNEFGVETASPKADALFKLVKRHIQKLGTPIDCIGLQNHYATDDDLPSVKDLLAQITRYNKIGLDVRISELDKDIGNNLSKKSLDYQAQYFLNVLQACLAARTQAAATKTSQTKGRKHGTCIGYSFWGFTDKYGSLGGGFGADNIGHGLLLDQHYKPKPGYTSVYDHLKGLKH